MEGMSGAGYLNTEYDDQFMVEVDSATIHGSNNAKYTYNYESDKELAFAV
ncbi:MAG: hypothetical protein SVM80_07455 [Halobacteriota archaeon]|nr:hypothetical protein [Halobacteriota archaeon]